MDGHHSVKSGASQAKRPATFRRRLPFAGALVGLVGFGVVLFSAPRSREPPVLAPRAMRGSAADDAWARHASFPRPPTVEPEQVHAKLSTPNPTPPLRESLSLENALSRGHPHPITPEHERIFEENSRIGALNGAMDQGNFAALRRLNAQYRRDYPEDAHVLHDGYDLVADCLERRSSRTHAAARRFWQEQRASSLRRYVRRYCLEGELPP
jgi:hypothetical protein